jgi:hypothetical protein
MPSTVLRTAAGTARADTDVAIEAAVHAPGEVLHGNRQREIGNRYPHVVG